MCFNCGCHIPDDNMGSVDNITNDTFEHLAAKWNKPVKEVKQMVFNLLQNQQVEENADLKELFEKASKAWGQPIEDTKKNTLSLLKSEL